MPEINTIPRKDNTIPQEGEYNTKKGDREDEVEPEIELQSGQVSCQLTHRAHFSQVSFSFLRTWSRFRQSIKISFPGAKRKSADMDAIRKKMQSLKSETDGEFFKIFFWQKNKKCC